MIRIFVRLKAETHPFRVARQDCENQIIYINKLKKTNQ